MVSSTNAVGESSKIFLKTSDILSPILHSIQDLLSWRKRSNHFSVHPTTNQSCSRRGAISNKLRYIKVTKRDRQLSMNFSSNGRNGSPPALVGTAYLVPSCSPHSSVSRNHRYKASPADYLRDSGKTGRYREREQSSQVCIGFVRRKLSRAQPNLRNAYRPGASTTSVFAVAHSVHEGRRSDTT